MKPFNRFQGRGKDAHFFHLDDEVQDIAAMFAPAETIPDVLC